MRGERSVCDVREVCEREVCERSVCVASVCERSVCVRKVHVFQLVQLEVGYELHCA